MSPPPRPDRRRSTAPRVPAESTNERSEFHPSVLRMGSPTQVRLGAGQVATARLPRDRSGAQEHFTLARKGSSESGAETGHASAEAFQTPSRGRHRLPAPPASLPPSPVDSRSPASTLSLSLDRGVHRVVDSGGLLFIDDIALRDICLSREGVGYPWLRFSFGAQPSKCTAPSRIDSSDSESYRYVQPCATFDLWWG